MSWDEYYLNMCNAVASNTKCLSRKIGSVLVKDKRIVSTGYNGPPEGIPSCSVRHQKDLDLYSAYKKIDPFFDRQQVTVKCPRQVIGFKSGEGLDWCVAGHAERNSLISAARNGIATKDCIMYMNCAIPCTPCLVEIINAGIKEIVVTAFSYYDVSSKYVLENSKLNARVFSHLCKHEEVNENEEHTALVLCPKCKNYIRKKLDGRYDRL